MIPQKKVKLGGTVDAEFTTLENVAEVALMVASFPASALTASLWW
jgi:3-hydroxybutyrate dehydrogenase